MKNRILTLIIGLLTGAILVTMVFLISIKIITHNQIFDRVPPSENREMYRPDMNLGEPSEKPNSDENQFYKRKQIINLFFL